MFGKKKRFLALAVALVMAASVVPCAAADVENTPVDVFTAVTAADGDYVINGSSIAALPDGSLLAVWSQGDGGVDGRTTRIMGSRLPDQNSDWTTPFLVMDIKGVADMDPSLYVDSDGTLWMFWYPVLGGISASSQMRFAWAKDGHYSYEDVGNRSPEWDWADQLPLMIGPNTGDPVASGRNSWPFVEAVQEGYVALQSHLEEEDVLDDNYDALLERYVNVMQKIGGDPDYQIFTPTVADKLYPKQGVLQRTGYPLLRRIGWQSKGTPVEIMVPAGTTLSDTSEAEEDTIRFVIPLYSEELHMSIAMYTDDKGVTWQVSQPIVGDDNLQAELMVIDNEILAVMSTGDEGCIQGLPQIATSGDGVNWTSATYVVDETLPDSTNGIDAVYAQNDDTILLVAAGSDGVCVAVEGEEEWQVATIENETGVIYSQPCVVERGNEFCITYTVTDPKKGNTVRFVTIDADSITAQT